VLGIEDNVRAVLLPWEGAGWRAVQLRAVWAVRRKVLDSSHVGHLCVPGVLGVAFTVATAIAVGAVVGAAVATSIAAAVATAVGAAIIGPTRFAKIVSEERS